MQRLRVVGDDVPDAVVGGRPDDTQVAAVRLMVDELIGDGCISDETWAARNVGPRKAIGTAARNVGSGSQTSNAGWGNTSGGVW